VESKCFKNMEALEEMMNNHNINIDSSSSKSSSHGNALSPSGFSSMQLILLLLISALLILEHIIIWLRIKPYFIFLMNVTPIIYLLVMIDLLMLYDLEQLR
jgi:hypothetical protein